MIWYTFKIAWRNICREPVFVALSTAGLGVGMATFIFIGLYVWHEKSYDQYHRDADRLYRVVNHFLSDGGGDFARTPPILAPIIKAECPEVEAVTRFQRYISVFRVGDLAFSEKNIFFTDPDTWQMFSWNLEKGSLARFYEPNTVVLSSTLAKKYFGRDNPIGKTLFFKDSTSLSVIGVIEDVPFESHFHADALISWPTIEQFIQKKYLETWGSNTFYTYIKLSEEASLPGLEARLAGIVKKYLGEDSGRSLSLQEMTSIHLHSHLQQELEPTGDATMVDVLVLVACFVLFLACVNFVNLSTARSSTRVKSIAIHKVVGAPRAEIFVYLLLEALLICLLAVIAAVAIIELALPWFNELTGKSFQPGWWFSWQTVGLMMGSVLVIGLFAGFYPAVLLSGFDPLRILKRDLSWAGGAQLRHVLLVVQFAVTIALLGGAITILRQIRFIQNRNLGYDQSQIAVIPYQWNSRVTAQLKTVKNELERIPGVLGVTASGDIPGRMSTHMGYRIETMPENSDHGIQMLVIDPDFLETYKLQLISGKNLSESGGENDVLVNESFLRDVGWTADQAIGKSFEMNGRGRIVGIVHDFYYNALYEPVKPLVMTYWPGWLGYVSIRLDRNISGALSGIGETWKKLLPGQPFEFVFLDADFDLQYRSEQRFASVLSTFSFVSVFIAALGLFGLAAYTIQRRNKELSLRRVLGASFYSIVRLLTGDYSTLVLVSALISVPVAYLFIDGWLNQFAVRVDMIIGSLLIPVGFVLMLILLMIAIQCRRILGSNPAETLRNE